MSRTRPPVVAGVFYPADPATLARTVDADVAAAPVPAADSSAPKAIIVPHAGYEYSGPIAGSGYAQLAGARDRIGRVVLLGPAHRVRLRGIAVPGADAFATPLGPIEVDVEARDRVLALPQVSIDDRAHATEHSLEVQLPFLQRVLASFRVLPLAVGDAAPGEVAEVLDAVWGGTETAIVVSSDLSHYHDYDTAAALDRRTAETIVAARPEDLSIGDACGAHAVRGLLETARRRRLQIHLLDLRSSGDTTGDRDAVVGYAAFAVT